MAASIITMPGVNCRFYAQGRCMFEELRNPGLDESRRCSVLAGWMDQFDSFVNQADRFHLEEDVAASIWQRRLEQLVRRGPECENFQYAAFCQWPGSCSWPRSEGQGDGECSCDGPECTGDCSSDVEGGTAQVHFACAHARQELCLLSLPRCEGICKNFQAFRPDHHCSEATRPSER